jgi:hypothetical protein
MLHAHAPAAPPPPMLHAHAPRPPAPPPAPPAPRERAPQPTFGLNDDILGRGSSEIDARNEPQFRQVFDQFVKAKRSCNESISGLVYERFAEKLVKNRDDLMQKTGCRDVRFTVYVKDGKAALKATPVKDEG